MVTVSCGSSTTLKLVSVPPGAKVFAKNMSSATSEELGVTPLVMKAEDLEAKKFNDSRLIIEMTKEGYHPRSILLTETSRVDIDISLKLMPFDKVNDAKSYDKIIGQLFEARRLVRIKNYIEALKITTEIRKTYPEISIPDEIEGSIYYLQQDFTRALNSFNVAYGKNPDSAFSLKMKKIIEGKAKVGK